MTEQDFTRTQIAPIQPASVHEMRRALQSIGSLWQAAQVEYHGEYSAPRLKDLAAFYSRASIVHVIAVIIVSTFPCLLVVVGADFIPLSPTEAGYAGNKGFWTRSFVVISIASLSLIELIQRAANLPLMRFTRSILTSAFVGLFSTAASVAVAKLIGFPIPFFTLTTSSSFLTSLSVCLAISWRPFFLEDHSRWTKTVEYIKILLTQAISTIIYPVYFFIFRQLAPIPQACFSLVLPLLRVVLKNVSSRCYQCHVDLRPEETVLNIELLSSLFVTFSMQSSTTILPVVLLTAVDIIHLCASVSDLHQLSCDLNQTRRHIHSLQSRQTSRAIAVHNLNTARCGILHEALDIINQADKVQARRFTAKTTARSFGTWRINPAPLESQASTKTISTKPNRATKIIPRPAPKQVNVAGPVAPCMPSSASRQATLRGTSKSAQLIYQQELFVLQTLRFLHATEYVVLVEFTEIIIPSIYHIVSRGRIVIYLSVVIQLPNRQYYPQLEDMDTLQYHQLAFNLAVYASLELLTFLLLNWIVWRRIRFSLLRQLSFVLEHQYRTVQAKLVLWVVYVVQCTLAHCGADYTFQFKWLRK